MQLAKDGKLGLGITHGDPFADNILSDPESGKLSEFLTSKMSVLALYFSI